MYLRRINLPKKYLFSPITCGEKKPISDVQVKSFCWHVSTISISCFFSLPFLSVQTWSGLKYSFACLFVYLLLMCRFFSSVLLVIVNVFGAHRWSHTHFCPEHFVTKLVCVCVLACVRVCVNCKAFWASKNVSLLLLYFSPVSRSGCYWSGFIYIETVQCLLPRSIQPSETQHVPSDPPKKKRRVSNNKQRKITPFFLIPGNTAAL